MPPVAQSAVPYVLGNYPVKENTNVIFTGQIQWMDYLIARPTLSLPIDQVHLRREFITQLLVIDPKIEWK